jgi:bifunctional oligoribonuclease and PAP phosphatase NrnA
MPTPPSTATTLTSTATLEQVASRLRTARRVVVLTHVKPDGDALGSTLAATRTLNSLRPGTARAVYSGPFQPGLRDIAKQTPCVFAEPGKYGQEALAQGLDPIADVILITDTCSWNQLEPFAEYIRDRRAAGATVCAVDHHVQGNSDIADMLVSDVASAAVCQPVSTLCGLLLQLPHGAPLPAEIAEPLYLGLATDTGWFRHSNVSSSVLRLASTLLDAGTDHTWLYRTTEQQETVHRLRLIAAALGSVELRQHDQLALMVLTLADMKRVGAQPGETGGLTDFTQSLSSVRVSALLTEVPADQAASGRAMVKISMRSKEGVDVNAIAGALGGGGHVRAAGARVTMRVEDAKDAIERLVAQQLAS